MRTVTLMSHAEHRVALSAWGPQALVRRVSACWVFQCGDLWGPLERPVLPIRWRLADPGW